MDDGQLDDSPLTMKDLDRICKAFLTVLTGVFHHRVEYPKVDIPRNGDTPVIEGGGSGENTEEKKADKAAASEKKEEIVVEAVVEDAEAAEEAPAQQEEPVQEKTEE